MVSPPSVVSLKRPWRWVCLGLLLVMSTGGYGQHVTPMVMNPAGESFTTAFTMGTMSVGEVAVTSLSGTEAIITQGFLQPEIGLPCADFQLSYFPNPVIDFMRIIDSECNRLASHVEVYDTQGKLVKRVALEKQEVDLRDLRQGIYITKVFGFGDELLGSFRMAKVPTE